MTTSTIDLASLTSLVLSALVVEDALTARDLGARIGLTATQLRPALRHLVAAGAVVTSGLTRGTRYCLAVEEQVEPAVEVVERVPAAARRPTRSPRRAPVIEVVDLTEQLAQTLALATPDAPLHTVRSEPAPVVQRLASELELLAALQAADPFQPAAWVAIWQ